jgi:hypothetical protein
MASTLGLRVLNSTRPTSPEDVISSFAEQYVIGWRHLFNGQFSTQRRIKQDYYYIPRQKIQILTQTGAGWSLPMLTSLGTEFLTSWTGKK